MLDLKVCSGFEWTYTSFITGCMQEELGQLRAGLNVAIRAHGAPSRGPCLGIGRCCATPNEGDSGKKISEPTEFGWMGGVHLI